jgi:hypothetical protein
MRIYTIIAAIAGVFALATDAGPAVAAARAPVVIPAAEASPSEGIQQVHYRHRYYHPHHRHPHHYHHHHHHHY